MSKTFMLAAGLAGANAAGLFSEDLKVQQYSFEQFKMEYGRNYASADEEKTRFGHFISNLKIIDERNQAETGSAVHGITKFTDLSQEEFKSMFLTAKSSAASTSSLRSIVEHVEAPVNATSSLVDWSGVYTTPVKDQGYCGSCWAFSATEQLESDAMRVLGTNYILSSEQTNQCTPYRFGGGCNGGLTETAYDYFRTGGGLNQDSDYPYTASTYAGKTGDCTVDTKKDVLAITGYTTIKGESNMASYMQTTGPLSVCVAAEVWNSYRNGILETCPGGVDHCVQAVGVDTSAVGGYWKVRNSWGTGWGESGYIRLAYGSNTCKITDDPTYVAPKKV